MKQRTLLLCSLLCLFATVCLAQDPAKVDAKHYKIESENAKVRILRIHYGPHEKSVMHSHPDGVITYLSDGTMTMHTPDGKSQEMTSKKGQTLFAPGGVHQPENTGDQPFDAVLVELKGGKSAPAKAAKK